LKNFIRDKYAKKLEIFWFTKIHELCGKLPADAIAAGAFGMVIGMVIGAMIGAVIMAAINAGTGAIYAAVKSH